MLSMFEFALFLLFLCVRQICGGKRIKDGHTGSSGFGLPILPLFKSIQPISTETTTNPNL